MQTFSLKELLRGHYGFQERDFGRRGTALNLTLNHGRSVLQTFGRLRRLCRRNRVTLLDVIIPGMSLYISRQTFGRVFTVGLFEHYPRVAGYTGKDFPFDEWRKIEQLDEFYTYIDAKANEGISWMASNLIWTYAAEIKIQTARVEN